MSCKDEATSTRGEGESEGSASLSEGAMGQLVHYLMPQVFFVVIFQKARQVQRSTFAKCHIMSIAL